MDDHVHELLVDTVKLDASKTVLTGTIRNNKTSDELLLEIYGFADRTFRLKLNELKPQRKRYEVDISIDKLPKAILMELQQQHGQIQLNFASKLHLNLNINPFRVDIYDEGTLLSSINSQNLLLIEPMRLKPGFVPNSDKSAGDKQVDDVPAGNEDEHEDEHHEEVEKEDGGEEKHETEVKSDEPWEETFKGHVDSKPYGPNSIGVDVTFFGYENVYGLPEHADSFRLRSTKDTDPYRLYNLDVFEYELNNPMALYGSIPFMLAHNERSTLGMYWNNAAETWVDVDYGSISLTGSLFGGSNTIKTDTHWFSETGIIDIFFFLGPKPADVSRQFTGLVGRPYLPPFATLGYHQCRWNYNDEKDVATVHENFDRYDIPVDFIWLDIEYTDGKRYFTWDTPKFPHPIDMINNLTAKGRNLIVISDPHIKKDDNYFIFKEMLDKGLYVKTKDGKDYEGWCWPGASYYPDFMNPAVSEYYADLYSRESFDKIWTWNDMNEPSVFNGPEITMLKDIQHIGGLEHREVHNIYGIAHTKSTFEGHLKRSDNKIRPFILTRSFFTGSQRYTAVWTGDNMAEWGHLKISNPMLLSLGIAGMTFGGADVGGFFKNPDAQLLARWYQAAAFQPFFRSHAHIDTRRREPWLFDEQTMLIIRDTIRARYTFLPFWYTLFFKASQTGLPMMRPLWYEFPQDQNTFAMDDEYLLGDALLVKPVTEENTKSLDVYFPGSSAETWHDITTLTVYKGGSKSHIDTPMNKIPIFQRGGTIIPRRFRVRRSAILSIEDPITLSIALNKTGDAQGSLYLDDGLSREHLEGNYFSIKMELKDNILSSRAVHSAKTYKTKVWLERIYLAGFKFKPSSIELNELSSGQKKVLEYFYDDKHHVLTIRKPDVNMSREWTMIFRP